VAYFVSLSCMLPSSFGRRRAGINIINSRTSWIFANGVERQTSRALRYFSTHCCAWKHAVSVGASCFIFSTNAAFFKSLSALAIHSRTRAMTVAGTDIHYLPFSDRRPLNRADHVFAPGELLRLGNNDIQRHAD